MFFENCVVNADPASYIPVVVPYAQAAKALYGTPVSIPIAQSALETGWDIPKSYNNFFNIEYYAKADPYTIGKTPDGWRAYNSPSDAFLGYAYFVTHDGYYIGQNGNKINCLPDLGNPEQFLHDIAFDGFDGGPRALQSVFQNYFNTIWSIVQTNNLLAYDNGSTNNIGTVVNENDTASESDQEGFLQTGPTNFWNSATDSGNESAMCWTWNNFNVVQNTGYWRPNLPQAGSYNVSVYIPSIDATTKHADYQIYASDGRHDVIIDQDNYYSAWVSLGKFTFSAGTGGYLALPDQTGEAVNTTRIGYDTAQWELTSAPTAPTISFNTSNINKWFGPADVNSQIVSWTLNDQGNGIGGLSQAWDTPAPTSIVFPGSTTGYMSFSYLDTSNRDGKHTVNVNAWDATGAVSSSASSGWYGYDSTPPTVLITSGQQANLAYTTPQTITWTIADAGSGLANWGEAWDSDAAGSSTAGSGSATLPAGTHTLNIHAWDNVGNNQDWTFGPFVYNPPQPPTITSFSPTSGPVGTTVIISGTNFSSPSWVHFTNTGLAEPSNVTATSLQTVVPAGAQSGPINYVCLNAGGGTVSTASFTVTLGVVPTPTISPTGGTFQGTQTIALNDTQNEVSIYYTTDGSIPSTTSTQYSSPIAIQSSETIKAIAVANGYTDSAVASAAFTIEQPVPTPTASPNGGTFTGTQTVTLSDSQSGTTICYTTDGSAPSAASTQYTSPISVQSSETVNAIAVMNGYTDSAVASAAFTIKQTVSTPTITPNGGTFTGAQTVTLSDAQSGANIYYTTDGSIPTTNSAVYSAPITVSSTVTINAIATLSGFANSGLASASFTFSTPLPVATFPAGLQMVSLPYTYSDISLDSIFGYSGVKLAVWQQGSFDYAVTPTAPSDAIVVGQGYWVRFPQAVTVTQAGTQAPAHKAFIIQLQAGWNMVGDPFTSSVPLTSLSFSAESQTFAQATGSTNPLIGNAVYTFGGGDTSYTAATSLDPNVGYWIFAYSAIDMDIPAPGARQGGQLK